MMQEKMTIDEREKIANEIEKQGIKWISNEKKKRYKKYKKVR